jgi:hypothetical protein
VSWQGKIKKLRGVEGDDVPVPAHFHWRPSNRASSMCAILMNMERVEESLLNIFGVKPKIEIEVSGLTGFTPSCCKVEPICSTSS